MVLVFGHEFFLYRYENLWGNKIGMASYFTNQTLSGAIKMDSTGGLIIANMNLKASFSVVSMTMTRSILVVFLIVVTLLVASIQTIVGVTSILSEVHGLSRRRSSLSLTIG